MNNSQIEEIKRLNSQNWSLSAIAHKFNTTPSEIREVLRAGKE